MRSSLVCALLFATALPASARSYGSPPDPDANKYSGFEWLDILVGEAVGEIGSRTYDVHTKDNFAGTTNLGGGYALTGGFGLRSVVRLDTGVRFSFEGAGQWGRMTNVQSGFTSLSTVTRGEFLVGIGYELPIGKWLVLHTATLVGVDYQTMDAQQGGSSAPAALSTVAVITPPPAGPSLMLDQTSLRLGQQVGLHVQLAKMVALYADGTIDYDGQWRVRAGISIGQVKPRR